MFVKLKNAALMLMAAGLILFSCTKEFKLDVTETAITFTSGTTTAQMHVTSSGEWAITGPDWVSFSPASGNGDQTVTVTLDSKLVGLNLSGVINVTGGDKSQTVTVSQKGTDFLVSPETVEFDSEGTPITLTVLSSYDWKLSIPSTLTWLSADKTSGGKGNTELTLTPAPITDRTPRPTDFITLDYGTSFSMIPVSQTMPNEAPTAAVPVTPADGATDVSVNVTFVWKAATDPDGDPVTYTLMLSSDGGNTWSSSEFTGTSGKPSGFLKTNTDYKWKLIAKDSYDARTESAVASFRTGSAGAYQNGQVTVIQEASAGAPKAVQLVFMGDGFIADDYVFGGAFDKAVETAVDAFFSIEPYKTYRNYFRISTVAVYSKERGATVQNPMSNQPAQSHDTAFKATLEGGNSTGTSCDYNKVLSTAKTVDGVDDTMLKNTTVLLLINIDAYAGTCLMYADGQSVSMCPMGKSSFRNVVMHEAGGHGFGRLLDEYRYYNETIPTDRKQMIASWRTIDPYYGYNVDLTGDRSQVHWKQYFTMAGYSAVGLYEGACLYSKSIWRPEYISCMEDNRQYYNAPSREAIVRRIFRAAGATFNMNDFVSKDKVKASPTQAQFVTPGFVPFAPPILMEGGWHEQN